MDRYVLSQVDIKSTLDALLRPCASSNNGVSGVRISYAQRQHKWAIVRAQCGSKVRRRNRQPLRIIIIIISIVGRPLVDISHPHLQGEIWVVILIYLYSVLYGPSTTTSTALRLAMSVILALLRLFSFLLRWTVWWWLWWWNNTAKQFFKLKI